MADDFGSNAVSASKGLSDSLQEETTDTNSLSIKHKAGSGEETQFKGNVKMDTDLFLKKDSENLEKFKVGVSETQEFEVEDNTHELKVTNLECPSGILAENSCFLDVDKGKLGSNNDDGSVRCTLKIEVIDDTAMIDASADKRSMVFSGKSATNNNNKKKENGEMRVPRKGKGGNKEKSVIIFNGDTANSSQVEACEKGGEAKRVYSRKELENLRFIGVEEQRKKWVEVYCGLGDTVQREYDGLVGCNNQKNKRPDSNPRRRRGKENVPVISGSDHSEHLDDQEWDIDTMNSHLAFPLDGGIGFSYEGESNVYEESDDSDDDYSSIQRPAFLVSGEPDFDSGPPEDGLEYLRRVRWEASQLPKVQVAKVESKLNKEQTCYMPQIPGIEKCLEHLLPCKEWEEAFLADFSELRQALSRLEASHVVTSNQPPPPTFVHEELSSNQVPEGIVLEKFDGLMSGDDESCLSDAGDDCPSLGNTLPKSSPSGGFGNWPTLSVILQMDSVSRVSILRKRVTAVENMSTLSRDDCSWLFALCAAVDTPLDADTCAALRSLLRKCASLRAERSKLDDEVVMLNVLATISGRYFGQLEK